MKDTIALPKALVERLLKYLDSKPMSQECRQLAMKLREEMNEGGVNHGKEKQEER